MTFLRDTRPTLPPARANLLFVSALRADELWRHDYGLVKGGERRPPVATGCIFLYASFFWERRMVAAAGGRWAAPVPRVIYVGRRALVGV